MKLDDSLTELLSRIADEPGPPSTVDLDRAAAAARRTKNRRRAGGAAGGTAAAALAAVLCIVMLSGRGGDAPGAAGQTPTASPSGTAALSGSDPLTIPATFSTLPTGFSVTMVEVDADDPEILSIADGATEQQATLTLLPAGRSPAPPNEGGPAAMQTPASPVGGDQAMWYLAPGSIQADREGQVMLSWEIAPNQWADLGFAGPYTGVAITSTVYQLAESVQFGASQAYPLPLHFTPPAGTPFTDAQYEPEPSGPSFSLTYGNADASVSSGGMLTIVVSMSDGLTPPDPTATTVNGCALNVVGAAPKADTVEAPDCNGLDITISVVGTELQALAGHGGIGGLFKSIAWLGSDPVNWTTHVIG